MAVGSLLAGLLGAGLQANAQAGATNLGYANLAFQKQNAREQRRLATAGREDAYGNKQRFDDLLNEWLIELTPQQEAILKAGEREQLLSLTEDARRNRDTRRRQETRALEAEKDFNRVRADYRYNQPRDELAIRDEIMGLLAGARSDREREGGNIAARLALRVGRGGDIPGIIRSVSQSIGGGAGEDMLRARTAALAESQARNQAHQGKYLPEMQILAGLMDSVGNAPQMFSNLPAQLSSEQGQILQAMMAALSNESGQVGNAYNQLAALVGQSPDVSGIGRGLDGLMKFSGKGAVGTGGSGVGGNPLAALIPTPRPDPRRVEARGGPSPFNNLF